MRAVHSSMMDELQADRDSGLRGKHIPTVASFRRQISMNCLISDTSEGILIWFLRYRRLSRSVELVFLLVSVDEF